MDNKYSKLLIAIFIILIISIIIIILLILNFKQNPDLMEENIGDVGEEIDFNIIEIEPVTEKIEYYTVRNCINNYLNSLNKNSTTYYMLDEYDEDMQEEYIYNLLSKEYIKNNDIQKNNIFNYIDAIDEKQVFIPVKMNVLEKENVKKYAAYGIIQNSNNEFQKELYIIVNLDFVNKTYSIEPLKNSYNNINEVNIENNNILIEKNGYNDYIEQKITNQYITTEYFELYKKLVLTNPDIIYNSMDKDYIEVRFGSLNNFKKYINDNIEEIQKIKLEQYLVNNYEDHIEYVGKDQFGNLYIFNEYEGYEINIKLDTYTIAEDKFIKEYEQATEQKKVQMNVDKFIQMINRHDYMSSYSCISEGFKNNYFNAQEDFENTIKNNFFDYNNFEFKNIEKKGNNIYICTIQLSDSTEENKELRDISLIIQLNDGIDFEMSFSI